MQVTLDWPSAILSPNWRGHWGSKAKEVKEARAAAHWLAVEAFGTKPPRIAGPVDVLMVFHPPAAHHYDLDNLQARMKAALDGLASALGVDDACFRPVSQMGKQAKGGFVAVTLTPATVEIPLRGVVS